MRVVTLGSLDATAAVVPAVGGESLLGLADMNPKLVFGVGFLAGLALGALGMHVAMQKGRR